MELLDPDGGDGADSIGGDKEFYRTTAAQLAEMTGRRVVKWAEEASLPAVDHGGLLPAVRGTQTADQAAALHMRGGKCFREKHSEGHNGVE